tara:strand:- start:33 stop:185 length:153 start_codon:yes stop_codon:yes gene_type:complete
VCFFITYYEKKELDCLKMQNKVGLLNMKLMIELESKKGLEKAKSTLRPLL